MDGLPMLLLPLAGMFIFMPGIGMTLGLSLGWVLAKKPVLRPGLHDFLWPILATIVGGGIFYLSLPK